MQKTYNIFCLWFYMKRIFSEKIIRIVKNKKKLQEVLNVKITNNGKDVFISGTPEEEYVAEKVILALNLGFPFSVALLIKEKNFLFEVLNIKDYTKNKNLKRIRSRIIGRNGRVLSTLSSLTKSYFEIKENKVGIISQPESIENCQNAIISIINGSKQSKVYSFLEKNQVKPILDYGLKSFK